MRIARGCFERLPAYDVHFTWFMRQGWVLPTVSIQGISSQYTSGDTVSFKLDAQDNNSLKEISFKIENKDINKFWNINGTSAHVEDNFSTKDWEAGDYSYSLSVKDESDNVNIYKDNFTLLASRDTLNPSGNIMIKESYETGDTIEYKVAAQDNAALKLMSFRVENTGIQKQWNISGTSDSKSDSFSTDNWEPGTLIRLPT